MRRLTRMEIEVLADRIVEGYRCLPSQKDRPFLRVEPDILVQDLLGLAIRYRTLSANGSILGLTALGRMEVQLPYETQALQTMTLDGKTILIERTLQSPSVPTGRHGFTLAHEASHQILGRLSTRKHRKHDCCHVVYRSRQLSTAPDEDELQANALAAAILMPADLIFHYLQQFGIGEAMHFQNGTCSEDDYRRFSDIAVFLGVSRAALYIRLKELGLIKREAS